MKIKLSHKSKKFLKDGFVIQFKKKDSKELAMNIASMIQARVPQGKDYHGKTFAPYSKKKGYYGQYLSYEELRQEHGRSTKCNLTWTGQMLGSLAMQKDLSTYRGTSPKIKFLLGPSLAKHKSPFGGGDRISNNAIGYFIHTGKLGRHGRTGPIVQGPPRHWLGLTEKQGKDLGDIFNDIIRRALKRKIKK